LRRADAECPHVQPMREDDKSHDLWIAGFIDEGRNVVVLQCDACARETDSVPELEWRLSYRLVTEADAKRLVLANPHAKAISERGRKIEQEALVDENKKGGSN
jgi:hypothetical protein